MTETKPIAESKNFIVLDIYEKIAQPPTYQSEVDLERELISDLISQGYEYAKEINSPAKLLENLKQRLESLNEVKFTPSEWTRLLSEYLDAPNDGVNEKTRKIQDNHIYDFVFDDGHIQNIYLLDKKNIARNRVQVVNQFEQTGSFANRYDVTILVNGLPLVQIELKKRGVAIREAFNQIHRYAKESFNASNSLFKYLQIFVISNGTDTRYFANTTKRDKTSFDFTINWADSKNLPIRDIKDFTATFLAKNTLLSILTKYCVFDASDTLLIMRPYQIAATERILWKINSSHLSKCYAKPEGGGYIWHTTGSGKTLTSFKAARLATQLDFIDKVFFVVDRKDLDYQTMKEYQKFSKDSVNGSASCTELKRNTEKEDGKIIVTTIQKLNNLMKSESELAVYQKEVVFIFDECHRSQFGEVQKNLKKKFKRFFQFGFTGTPIFPQNASGAETTQSVFGSELHSYILTDAVRDEKVLKFKVDYNDVRPKFREFETEKDELKLSAAESKEAFLHPDRIKEISQYILDRFRQKTHRLNASGKGFNAMFAVSSIEAAKLYYEAFKNLQKDKERPLKVATIFSFSQNEEQGVIGEIADENFEPETMDMSSKEFLNVAIKDYNAYFRTNFSIEGRSFQDYYRDLSERMKKQEVDLLLVVGMFLTGFDAPTLNTLFVDKNLRYHGLMQAFSRTNRILDATKTFGNIVTFRDLQQATIDAITLFGKNSTKNVILEKSYKEYMQGFTDAATGEARRGFLEVTSELEARFSDPNAIETQKDKKDFVKLFGEYLRVENALQNYDEFAALQALQGVNLNDENAVREFKEKFYLSEEDLQEMQSIKVPSVRALQDYRSTYNDIRDWLRKERAGERKEAQKMDWDDVVFEIDLLKSQEINLDYILGLIFEHNKKIKDKIALTEEIRRIIRASLENRSKEGLIVDFINGADLDELKDRAGVVEAFFKFAKGEMSREAKELIGSLNLNENAAKRYISASLKRGYASPNGTDLNESLPKMSPLSPKYLSAKQDAFEKIAFFVDKFKEVGIEV
jgi:type I site-specific deoxyribonuclease, hsdR family